MTHESAIEYVRKSLFEGHSPEDIRSALVSAGWSAEDVEHIMNSVSPSHAPEVHEHPSIAHYSPVGQRSQVPMLVGLLVLVAALIGGGVWAYQKYGNIFAKRTPKDQLFKTMLDHVSEMKSGTQTVSWVLETKPRVKGTEPLTWTAEPTTRQGKEIKKVFEESDTETYSAYIPGDLRFAITTSGSSQMATDKPADWHYDVAADIKYGDLTIAADVELSKKGSTYYGRLNKFPGAFFSDLSLIKGKWIKIDEQELERSYLDDLNTDDELKGTINDEAMALIKKFLTIAKEENVMVADYQAEEKVDNHTTYRYAVHLNRAALAAVYKRAANEMKLSNGKNAMEFDQEGYDFLQSHDLDPVFDYWEKYSSLTVWIDPVNAFPVKIASNLDVIPGKNSRRQESQLSISTALDWKDVNKPIVIPEPSPTMPLDEAMALVEGVSLNEYRVKQQIRNIREIRRALSAYYGIAGVFPGALSDLMIKQGELKKKFPQAAVQTKPTDGYDDLFGDGVTSTYGDDRPLLKSVPTDAYTKQPYTYAGKESAYTLRYSVKRDSKGAKMPYGRDSYGLTGENDPLDGMNTATAYQQTVEGCAAEQKQLTPDQRDKERIENLQEIQTRLDMYFQANKIYPNHLLKLLQKDLYNAYRFVDPSCELYAYDVAANKQAYHIGATLENSRSVQSAQVLAEDRDCSSRLGDTNVCEGFGKGVEYGVNGRDPVYDLARVTMTPPAAEADRLLPSIIASDHIWGPNSAKVTLFVYSDLECPFCLQFHQTIHALRLKYPNDLKIVYRHFPLTSLHPNARLAAEASECVAQVAGNDGFWKFIDAVFGASKVAKISSEALLQLPEVLDVNKGKFKQCMDAGRGAAKVDADIAVGTQLGIQGTPSWFVAGPTSTGSLQSGNQPYDTVLEHIQKALK